MQQSLRDAEPVERAAAGRARAPTSVRGRASTCRGALTLHALRLTVGDDSFFRILRAWADRYKYGNATTADFIALAKEEAPQVPAAALDALFDAWLYDRHDARPAGGGRGAPGRRSSDS